MPFSIYIIGTLIALVGVGAAMHLLGVSPIWIGVAMMVVAGIAIAGGASMTKKNTGTTTTTTKGDGGSETPS